MIWVCANDFRGVSVKQFARYAVARHNEKRREDVYKIYVTDALKLIAENTARGTQGNYINVRYYDAVHAKQETRTAEEIIAHIRQGLRGGEEYKLA